MHYSLSLVGKIVIFYHALTRVLGNDKHQTVERRSGKTHGGPDILLVAMFPRPARRSVMDPTTGFCPKKNCPARGQSGQGHIGLHSQQEQRFLCHAGHKTFSARPGTVFSRLRPSAETVVLLVGTLRSPGAGGAGGSGRTTTGPVTGAS